jgi:rubrerythrin
MDIWVPYGNRQRRRIVMQTFHERFLEDIKTERQRILSRRGLLTGSLKLAAGGALAMSLGNRIQLGAAAQDSTPAAVTFADDIEVLNYALTLEHLEYAFYRDGIGQFTFGTDPFGTSIDTNLAAVRDHEKAHVDTLTEVITQLGGTPVAEATYDFGYTDAASFLATSSAVENLGVQAYDGAGAAISNPDLLTAAGSIVAVEARHAAYLNLVIGQEPFPAAFETPATPDEVLAIAGPFIVS